jgi:hypothetical protein
LLLAFERVEQEYTPQLEGIKLEKLLVAKQWALTLVPLPLPLMLSLGQLTDLKGA